MHQLRTEDEELQCIALGHDLVEDTGTTYKELVEMAFSNRVINGIRALTKTTGESYDEYREKVKANRDAILVKMSDLRHNSDLRRLKNKTITEKDIQRMVKYHKFCIIIFIWNYKECCMLQMSKIEIGKKIRILEDEANRAVVSKGDILFIKSFQPKDEEGYVSFTAVDPLDRSIYENIPWSFNTKDQNIQWEIVESEQQMTNTQKPHKWAKEIIAWANGSEIEARLTISHKWESLKDPAWNKFIGEFRIKPESKPDVVKYAFGDEYSIGMLDETQIDTDNLKFIFDGETNRLKAVEYVEPKKD